MESLLSGIVCSYKLNDWVVTWESSIDYRYRHWCLQAHPNNNDMVLVVMLNPGSLSGDGRNIKKDTTLGILRKAFDGLGLNPFVVNLFDFATPSVDMLCENWTIRNKGNSIFTKLSAMQFSGVIYAYGDYENMTAIENIKNDIKNRIVEIKEYVSDINEIDLPKNINGSPMHPMFWQINKRMPEVRNKIKEFKKTHNQAVPLGT